MRTRKLNVIFGPPGTGKTTVAEVTGVSKENIQVDRLIMCDCYPEHCTHGETCWCEPQVETINGTRVIIHNEPN